ncbi:MAG: flagellar motor protein MotB [Candidatus Aadella gelida]|nr:flagellar motor protein MotB [Candidatus Aadella gelida]
MLNRSFFLTCVLILSISLMTSGCAVNFYKQSPKNKEKIQTLTSEISDLKKQQELERESFEEAKKMLEKKLKSEIADESISLEIDERGLVIILSDYILFDSGKAEVKEDANTVLSKVAQIIKKKVPGKNIGVGGHTDNIPITHSSWKSNWELSTTRATNVLHSLVERGVLPGKLSATGYGEHRSLGSNDTEEGRSANRRVEIVILPEFQEKRGGLSDEDKENDNIK